MLAIIKNDIKTIIRSKGVMLSYVIFFIIIASLFPFSIGNDAEILKSIGVGVVWVAALLSSTLTLNRTFEEDYDNGTLEQLILAPIMPSLIILAKIISNWLVSGLPIVFVSALVSLIYDLPLNQILILMLALLLGTPVISTIGVMGAAFTVGLKRAGVVTSLLVMPLYIPVLIFGSGLSQSVIFGYDSEQFMVNMVGIIFIFLITLPLSVWSSALSLKIALEE